jgi:hypothetical protein
MKLRPWTVNVLLVFLLLHSAWGASFHRIRKHPLRVRHPSRSVTPRTADLAMPKLEDEERRYELVKERVKADPSIQALKERSDAATGDEQGRNAAVEYYRAVFQKIRETDHTLTDRANLAEEALMRRLRE